MIAQVDRAVGRISTAMALLGAALLGALAVLIIIDIVGRQLGTPIRGTVELAATTVAAATFLTIPFAMRRRGHVRSTILVSRLPAGFGRVLQAFAYALGGAIFLLLAVSSYGAMVTAFVSGAYEGEGALRVPTYPTRAIIFVGSLVMAAECALAAVVAAKGQSDD